MIPAKITNLNPVQVTWYKLPKPKIQYGLAMENYEYSRTIADVENVDNWENFAFASMDGTKWQHKKLSLNQQVFIEPTTEGKCNIVKLNNK